MLCLGSGLELLHRVFKRESYHFDSGREGLEREHACITFTKAAGLALQALKSLFTVEQRVILAALKSATPWSETLKCTLCKNDGLPRWNDSHLCNNSRISQMLNKNTKAGFLLSKRIYLKVTVPPPNQKHRCFLLPVVLFINLDCFSVTCLVLEISAVESNPTAGQNVGYLHF